MVEAALDRVDWRDRFRTLFDGTMRSDASWARPNRRFLPHRIYLPGWRRAGAGRVAFVLDTSGSISAPELATYVANLLGLIDETGPEQIAIIQCDTTVKQVAYLGPGETIDCIEVHGRGGTLFQPAFDWIAGNGFDPHVIVYATDLDSRDTPTCPGVPVIWLTPSRGRAVPFGEIVEIAP
jgi:predicted metal-dependent peptidase